ncbi:concanavalin A-like lectin/glucanase domain-containing protein [Hyaloraphidium curvatum]|nr:concanavalin A-like lectin/glucanase domain-containing protein [Hyaloraphidium curvatum]
MSPNHDEIDFEWTLGSTQTGEFGVWTNWFKGGVPTDTPGFYGRGGICRHPANLRYTFVKYDFEWTRDRIRFLLNDRECYRVNRADPANRLIMPNGTAVVMFPTEPPNIQFGIWDGGGALSAPGTREWAGGATQWLTEPNASQGFGMTIRNVTVTCY